MTDPLVSYPMEFTLKSEQRFVPPVTVEATTLALAIERAEKLYPGRGPWKELLCRRLYDAQGSRIEPEAVYPEYVIYDNEEAREAIGRSVAADVSVAAVDTVDRLRAHLEAETEGQWSPAYRRPLSVDELARLPAERILHDALNSLPKRCQWGAWAMTDQCCLREGHSEPHRTVRHDRYKAPPPPVTLDAVRQVVREEVRAALQELAAWRVER